MNILWVGSQVQTTRSFMSYLSNSTKFSVSYMDESAINSLQGPQHDIDAVVYEASLESARFETSLSKLKSVLGSNVPVVAQFDNSLSCDLREYFSQKFDDILFHDDSFLDCTLKIEKISHCMRDVKRILIMEDDLDLAEMMISMLSNDRVEVYHANKGYDAILMCQKYKFDLLITDLIVEGINGFELVNYVNASYIHKKPEIIVISGAFGGQLEEKMEQLNVSNVFDKPFDICKFQKKINGLLYS